MLPISPFAVVNFERHGAMLQNRHVNQTEEILTAPPVASQDAAEALARTDSSAFIADVTRDRIGLQSPIPSGLMLRAHSTANEGAAMVELQPLRVGPPRVSARQLPTGPRARDAIRQRIHGQLEAAIECKRAYRTGAQGVRDLQRRFSTQLHADLTALVGNNQTAYYDMQIQIGVGRLTLLDSLRTRGTPERLSGELSDRIKQLHDHAQMIIEHPDTEPAFAAQYLNVDDTRGLTHRAYKLIEPFVRPADVATSAQPPPQRVQALRETFDSAISVRLHNASPGLARAGGHRPDAAATPSFAMPELLQMALERELASGYEWPRRPTLTSSSSTTGPQARPHHQRAQQSQRSVHATAERATAVGITPADLRRSQIMADFDRLPSAQRGEFLGRVQAAASNRDRERLTLRETLDNRTIHDVEAIIRLAHMQI